MTEKKKKPPGGKAARPQIDTAALLDRVDIVEVINARVPLAKSGAEYEACCPFHDEKTPSFKVSPSKQFYNCFGCGANGDAIKFLMEHDGLTFLDACRALGADVPESNAPPADRQPKRSDTGAKSSASADSAGGAGARGEKKRTEWVPILPVVSLLAGLGAAWTNARNWRAPLIAFVVFGLASNFVVLVSGPLGDNRFLADYGVLRRDPLRVDAWHLYLNEHTGEVAGVLLVGDAQPFDLEVPALYNTVFDDSVLEQLVGGRTPDEARRALAERGISHVYVNWGEVHRYRSPGNYGITEFIQPEVFDRLVAAGVLEALPPITDHRGQVFRVVAAAGRAQDAAAPQR